MNPIDYPVSFSHLKQFAHSPAHYLHSLTSGIEETSAMRIGKLVHASVLGGEFVVYDGTRRGKDWDAFRSVNRGKFIVTPSEVDQAGRIVDSLKANKTAMALLTGQHELEVHWNIGPRVCVSHLDCLGDAFITDLKVTNCTEPERFSQQAERMAWHAQLAWYKRAVEQDNKTVISGLYLVGVEPSAPYNVTILNMPASVIADGDRLCKDWFTQLIACETSGVFGGYTDQIYDMTVRSKRGDEETL